MSAKYIITSNKYKQMTNDQVGWCPQVGWCRQLQHDLSMSYNTIRWAGVDTIAFINLKNSSPW